MADDVAIGVPSEDIGSVRDGGAANVIYAAGFYGFSTCCAQPVDQFWHQNS